MAQKIRCSVIRNVRRNRQEGQGYPAHRTYLPIALSLSSRAQAFTGPVDRNHQLQVTKSAGISAVPLVNTETFAELASTNFHSSNLLFFKTAIQIERSCMAIVAKQEEFCCGPRQGN
jgi:hypothetical protein